MGNTLATRVAVVGYGHLGRYHVQKLLAESSVELVGVVDVHPEQRERAQAETGVQAVSDIDALPKHLDALIIATPTLTHVDVAERAIAWGWNVLIEKPVAASVRDAQRLRDVATRAKVVVQVGHTERFNPAISAALALADRPRYIVAERLGPFSGRSVDVDVVLDLMIHDLDIVAALVPAPLAEVRAVGVPVLTHETDMAAARLEFADGTVAQLSAGRASMEPSRKLRLFTVERYVSIDCLRREVKSVRRLPPAPGEHWPQLAGEPVEVPQDDALALQDRHFIACVRSGSTPRVSLDDGIRALELAEAVKAAMKMPF